jgi:ketosteroid isomerase-like protein
MSNEIHKQAVLDMHTAISRGDIDGMFSPMTEDVTFRVTGDHQVGQRVFQGKEDIVNNLLLTVFARLNGGVEIDIISIAAEDEKVFLHFTGKAQTLGGEPYNSEFVQIFDFRDGKISGIIEFLDTALLAKILG